MEIVIKANTTETSNGDNQPCTIEKYRLLYPFTLAKNGVKQVVWPYDDNDVVKPTYYKGGSSSGVLFFDVDVARKIEIKNTHFNTTQFNTTLRPNDFPETTTTSFFLKNPAIYFFYSKKNNICLQTHWGTMASYGEDDADQFITFQKKHFCTVTQDDNYANELVIMPKMRKFPPYLLPTTLEEARETLCFTFRYKELSLKNSQRQIHLIIPLEYEH